MTQSQELLNMSPEEFESIIYAMNEQEVASPKAYELVVAFCLGDRKAYDHYKRALLSHAGKISKETKTNVKQNWKEWEAEDRKAEDADRQDNSIDFDGMPDYVLPMSCGMWKCVGNEIRDFNGSVVTNTPLFPNKIINTQDGDCEKIEIVYRPRGCNAWKRRYFQRSTLATARGVLTLSNYGIDVTDENAGDIVGYIRDVMNGNELLHETEISHCGWDGDKFFPYENDAYAISDSANSQHIANFKKHAGTIEEWLEFTVPYLKEHPDLYEYFASALAAPILYVVNAQTFVSHIWAKTSFGKTLALKMCASAWGSPKLVKSLNNTVNSLTAYLDVNRNLPFFADEFQSISGYKDQSKLVYNICMEVGRGRLNANSEQQTTGEWRTVVLTTGETPILGDTDQAGATARMLEIHCEDVLYSKQNGQTVADFYEAHHGTFAPEYINLLKSKGKERMVEDYRNCKDCVIRELPYCQAKQVATAAAIMQASMYFAEIANQDRFVVGSNGTLKKYAPDGRGGFKTADNGRDYVMPMILPDAQREYLKTTEDVEMPKRAYDYVVSYVAANPGKFPTKTEYDDNKPKEVWGMAMGYDTKDEIRFNLVKLNSILREIGTDFNAVKEDWASAEKVRELKYNGGTERRFSGMVRIHGVLTNSVILVMPDKSVADDVMEVVNTPKAYGIDNDELLISVR